MPTSGPLNGVIYCLTVKSEPGGLPILYAGGRYGTVFYTSDNGDNWTEIDGGNWFRFPDDTGFTEDPINFLEVVPNGTGGTCLYAATLGNLFRSLNADTNWEPIGAGSIRSQIHCIAAQNELIVIGTDSGVCRSTDRGETWSTGDGRLVSYQVLSIVSTPDSQGAPILIAATSGGIFFSSDDGVNWMMRDSIERFSTHLTVDYQPNGEMRIYEVGIDEYMKYSVDTGSTWITMSQLPLYISYGITCLQIHDSIIFAGTTNRGVYYSNDNGNHWVDGSSGLGYGKGVNTVIVCGRFLMAGGWSALDNLLSVWRRPLSEMITDVRDKNSNSPPTIQLYPNYPNPFNPKTSITYALSTQSYITLKVYDLLGRELAILAQGKFDAGNHSAAWNASGFGSGVYFCKLEATSVTDGRRFTDVKKMVLVR